MELDLNNDNSEGKAVRSGWANVFDHMTKIADDKILYPDYIENDWDQEEWTW